MRYLATLLTGLIIAGCTSPEVRMEGSANEGDWAAAFEAMQYQMTKETPEAYSRAKDLVRKYPKVTEYGLESFTPDKLKKYADQVGEVEWHKIRLKYFCAVANTEQCLQAKQNVDEAEQNIRPLIIVLHEFYEQLSHAETKTLNSRNRIKLIPSNEVGVVLDRQLQDTSTPGNTAGSQLGAAIGSAAYVDKAFSGSPSNWNYSASGHLGAQITGALVGGMLNKQEQESYIIKYTVRYRNGRVGYIENVSSSPLGHSVGVCIRTTDYSLLEQSLCEGSLETFRRTLNP